MKYKDYKRLSKISLKARKKTTRSTVRGISFGLILLMPLLFIVIAFHLDLNKEVNKDPSIRVFNIAYTNEEIKSEYNIDYVKEENFGKIEEIKGIENIIKYNQYTFNNSYNVSNPLTGQQERVSPFSITIENKTFTLNDDLGSAEDYRQNEVGMLVIDTDVGDGIFLKADYNLTNNQPLFAGSEFSSNSAKEIMISSLILEKYNLTAENVVNKTITITYSLQYPNDATTSKTDDSANSTLYSYQEIPITILKDYKIVGVYDSRIYTSSARIDSQKAYLSKEDKYQTLFWVTKDSMIDVNGKNYLPEFIKIEKEEDSGYTYVRNMYYYGDNPVNLAKNARNNEKVFIPLGMGASEGLNGGDDCRQTFKTLVEFKAYSDANNAVSIVDNIYKQGVTNSEDLSVTTSYMQDTFMNYRMFYNVFTYACIILAIFGGVVFFATLLNLYNTIHYSVQSRRNYLGMIRAIGMKGKEVTKMYFIEISQTFKRAYIWTAIFGGGICFGISMLFKMIMESDVGAVLTINLSLNPIYILVAFVALLVVNTIISLAFALIACNNVSKKPILEVLVENR